MEFIGPRLGIVPIKRQLLIVRISKIMIKINAKKYG